LIELTVRLKERSPEKAGAGGSTPSLATIISKHLHDFAKTPQPKLDPRSSLNSFREQVHPVARQVILKHNKICYINSALWKD
jgi:hypothetical protein